MVGDEFSHEDEVFCSETTGEVSIGSGASMVTDSGIGSGDGAGSE